jgi:hypothetical protein
VARGTLHRIALLLTCALPAGCARAPQPYHGPPLGGANPASFIGCYQATFRTRAVTPANRWQFRLESSPASSNRPGGANGLPARRATASISGLSDPYWLVIPGGLRLTISDGYAATTIDLVVQGDQVSGWEYRSTDTMRGVSRRRVFARKLPCS